MGLLQAAMDSFPGLMGPSSLPQTAEIMRSRLCTHPAVVDQHVPSMLVWPGHVTGPGARPSCLARGAWTVCLVAPRGWCSHAISRASRWFSRSSRASTFFWLSSWWHRWLAGGTAGLVQSTEQSTFPCAEQFHGVHRVIYKYSEE